MTTQQSVLLEVDAGTGVAVLTLNRPERFNAFNREMIGAWRRALTRVESEPEIRALVVTGSGKAFCAGGDVDELDSFLTMRAMERKAYLWENVHQIPLLLERIDRPVIAAINGTARGAGLDMALMCDLRVIDATAVVGESYINLGLVPGDGGAWFLPRLVGTAQALELLWTGDPVDAETALRIGMVNRIAPEGQALPQAVALAKRIASQPPHAIRFIKRLVYQGLSGSMPLHAHLDAVSSHMAVVEDLPEFEQRLEAFRKRKERPR